jgi:nitrogen fixation/metabolism regulation signal transduction histidine kinase
MNSCDMKATTTTFVYPTQHVRVAPGIYQIRDWLVWSIVNLFLALGGGLLPLIFSLICRSKKRDDDVSGARTMSTLALIFNILATLSGILGWIFVIVRMIFVSKTMSTIDQIISDIKIDA